MMGQLEELWLDVFSSVLVIDLDVRIWKKKSAAAWNVELWRRWIRLVAVWRSDAADRYAIPKAAWSHEVTPKLLAGLLLSYVRVWFRQVVRYENKSLDEWSR